MRRRTKEFVPLVLSAAEFVRVRLGMEPDPIQTKLLESDGHRVILNCTRQWGKSTVAAMLAVYRAVTQGGSLVIVASRSRRQSAELIDKVRKMLTSAGIPHSGDGINVPSAVLKDNGSRIVGLPGREDTTRGFSAVSLLLIDEAARVSDSMYKSLHPMLATTDGDLWLMSTPNGKRGFFYEMWEYGGPEWTRVSVPATECPRIGSRFLESERGNLGAEWFRQEYLCEFVSRGNQVFDRDLVQAALNNDIEPFKF